MKPTDKVLKKFLAVDLMQYTNFDCEGYDGSWFNPLEKDSAQIWRCVDVLAAKGWEIKIHRYTNPTGYGEKWSVWLDEDPNKLGEHKRYAKTCHEELNKSIAYALFEALGGAG